MNTKSYKINPKHRAKAPSKEASIWTESEWIEIHICSEAGIQKWQTVGEDILWGVYSPNGEGILKIGQDMRNDLYIAKFRCDKNGEWHGYPVHPLDDDIPPETVLECWRKEKKIDNADKRRIQTGKFRK